MEPCDKKNGCLFVAPGSHTMGKLYPHDYSTGVSNKFYHGIQVRKCVSLGETRLPLVSTLRAF